MCLGVTAAPASGEPPSGPGARAVEAAAAPPPVRTIDPARLRRGPDATFAHLQDGWIHAGGRRIRVKVRADKGRQVLLGRSDGAWIVASWTKKRRGGATVRVHRIRAGRAPVPMPWAGLRGSGVGIRLSRDGQQVLLTVGSRGGLDLWVLRTRDGAEIATDTTGPSLCTQPYDAAGGRVLLHRQPAGEPDVTYAADWAPATGTDRRLGPGLNAGFLRQDVVFVGPAPGTPGPYAYGPTSISAPGTPAWSARFTALAVSPDKKLVIGTGPRRVKRRAVLQVRRMSDGKILQQLAYGAPGQVADQTARFETSSRFVFELTTRGRSRLVRCTTAGKCARASDAGGPLSASHELVQW
ncbi:hypothetical protein GCM10007231_31770 [Nocardioides daphniae]|uniref:WD40 repeat domain-containing protein n=1 Tax=Nocardioides daphniae TaxID=402297 RepID=A0ABQ1QJH8_9ACTN|nr:hypothetical protein GCM10007231_31770 [Nocardioides daphniae]